MTGSSLAGIVGAFAGVITAVSLLMGAMPAFRKMRREDMESRRQMTEKLDVIHTLTNASLTSAKESALQATKRELLMMREVISLNIEAGRQPSDDYLAATAQTQHRVEDMEQEMRERAAQGRAADIQLETARVRQDER